MNILSIDTSGLSFTITASTNNEIISFVGKPEMTSSETVLIEIDRLINHLKISPKDINTIIYNNGPGSFTGTRVSSAIVQAIGFSNQCPVYGVNSLMLISYSIYKAIGKQKIQVIKSAFGDQVFHGLFTVDKKNILSESQVTTSTLTDVCIDTNYFLVSDNKVIIEREKHCHLLGEVMGSELLIEYFHKYVTKKKKFYYEDALPSYAGHTI